MITYLMLDDDAAAASPAELYAEPIQAASKGQLEIVVRRPGRMGETVAMIAKLKPNGLLLDIALTNALDEDKQPVGFDGIALAQQVRTLQTRARTVTATRALPEFPIIRLSKKNIVGEYVSGDTTSDDLFDALIDKDSVFDNASVAARTAIALARDYPSLSKYADSDQGDDAIAALLASTPAAFVRLDPRTLLGIRRPNAPAHVLARFVITQLLGRPGPLVDEALLAIRLGVDTNASPDWGRLRARLDTARYKGAFGDGYLRWWMPAFNDWWQLEIEEERPAGRLTATERVALLRKRTELNGLAAIAPTDDNPGSRFWHRCIRSGLPVDPAEGFPLLPIYGHEIWHDTEYWCLEEGLRHPRDPRLSPTDRARAVAMIAKRGQQ